MGGYGISWNDELDLSADEIWHNRRLTGNVYEVDIMSQLGVNLTKAREIAGVTQKELSEKVHIYQQNRKRECESIRANVTEISRRNENEA